jgi:uncharacterized protein
MNIINTLASELEIKPEQVENTLKLIKEGDTIPFIARYRKEVTGSLDDVTLRKLDERLTYLNSLNERKDSIIASIKEQGKLTPELEESLNNATKLSELENLYRPYKKKRKTRGSVAKEAGLAPLEAYIEEQNGSEEQLRIEAKKYLNVEKGFDDVDKVIQGALDILAEKMGDNSTYYETAKAYIYHSGRLESKETKNDVEKKYATYASFSCPLHQVKNYQTLALNRGENEKCLTVSFAYDRLTIVNQISRDYLKGHSSFEALIRETALDAYKRLIEGVVTLEIRNELFTKAEDSSIILFKDNLKQLLLASPLKGHRILGFDPAFRNGCKLASIDEEGKLLHVGVIYPTVGGENNILESEKTLVSFLLNDHLDYIALGNGTASRESEAFINEVLKKHSLNIKVVIVNEAGASVYSASPLGTLEFPELSVEKRSAISLARRLLDPLSELVKIDPMAMGVGQYQHDLDEKKLSGALSGVVEDAVNEVGVYANLASPSLLKYVSGIGPSLADAIVNYRNEHGPFKTRKDLHSVPKLGPKAFEQAAGFLRIAGPNPLDNTGVHPESYDSALALLKELGLDVKDLGSAKSSSILSASLDIKALSSKLGMGEETLTDMIKELQKPGRDPRLDASTATLDANVKDIKEVKVGMVLNGTIRNITDFGAFVDIGVHQDGLIHISELSNTPISSPLEIVHIGQIVKVKVISIDLDRKRIGLSLKQVNS